MSGLIFKDSCQTCGGFQSSTLLFSDCSMSKSDWNCSGRVSGKSIFTIPSMLYAEQWLPKDVHILNIGSHDYVILQGKGEIKVAIDFEMRGHPSLSGLAYGNNKGPSKCRREREGWVSVQCDVTVWCDLSDHCWLWRWKHPWARECRQPPTLEKARKYSLLTSRRDHSSSNTSILELSNVYSWCFNPKVGGHLLEQ